MGGVVSRSAGPSSPNQGHGDPSGRANPWMDGRQNRRDQRLHQPTLGAVCYITCTPSKRNSSLLFLFLIPKMGPGLSGFKGHHNQVTYMCDMLSMATSPASANCAHAEMKGGEGGTKPRGRDRTCPVAAESVLWRLHGCPKGLQPGSQRW